MESFERTKQEARKALLNSAPIVLGEYDCPLGIMVVTSIAKSLSTSKNMIVYHNKTTNPNQHYVGTVQEFKDVLLYIVS